VLGVVGFADWALYLTVRQTVRAVVIRELVGSASHRFSLSGALARLLSVDSSRRALSGERTYPKPSSGLMFLQVHVDAIGAETSARASLTSRFHVFVGLGAQHAAGRCGIVAEVHC